MNGTSIRKNNNKFAEQNMNTYCYYLGGDCHHCVFNSGHVENATKNSNFVLENNDSVSLMDSKNTTKIK